MKEKVQETSSKNKSLKKNKNERNLKENTKKKIKIGPFTKIYVLFIATMN